MTLLAESLLEHVPLSRFISLDKPLIWIRFYLLQTGQGFQLLKTPLSQYYPLGMDDAVADSVTWDASAFTPQKTLVALATEVFSQQHVMT
jgi:hypothetical protein